MLRDKNLIPLSHQHQHALALCVRIDRADPTMADMEAWQAEIQQIWEQEISVHFAAEETVLFPAVVRLDDLRKVVTELIGEHEVLRGFFARARQRTLHPESLKTFGQTLAAHVRKEERQLFESMQKQLSAAELAAVGADLDRELAQAPDACLLPSETTRLRPKK